jgi:hypothetical protein
VVFIILSFIYYFVAGDKPHRVRNRSGGASLPNLRWGDGFPFITRKGLNKFRLGVQSLNGPNGGEIGCQSQDFPARKQRAAARYVTTNSVLMRTENSSKHFIQFTTSHLHPQHLTPTTPRAIGGLCRRS